MTLYKILAGIALSLSIISCNPSTTTHYNTPATLTGSSPQTIEFNADKDAVFEGSEGVVVAIPKGGLINGDGEIVTGLVSAQLIEAMEVSSQLINELGISESDRIVQTVGTIQLTFTSDGEEVFINPENPAYGEIPSNSEEGEMIVYSGERESDGSISWLDSTTSPKYLINVPFELLTFTPPNFERTVREVSCSSYTIYEDSTQSDMVATPEDCETNFSKEELDSIYFSIVGYEDGSPCYYHDPLEIDDYLNYHHCTHIIPRSIFTIYQSPFDSTFIATRAFERRLKTIHRSQNRALLEIYINNLDKNLWEVDQMAHSKAVELFGDDSELSVEFQNYAAEKLTNVKDAPHSAMQLASYYQDKLDSLKREQARQSQELQHDIAEQNKAAEELAKSYLRTVQKRNSYRLEKYGFTITSPITSVVLKKKYVEIEPVKILVKVDHAEDMQLIRSYIVLKTPESILKLNNVGSSEFARTITSDAYFNTSVNSGNTLVVLAFKDNTPWLKIQPIQLLKENQTIHISLEKSSNSELLSILKQLDRKKEGFNRIEDDLEYHLTMQTIQRKRSELIHQQTFICKLYCAIHEQVYEEYRVHNIVPTDVQYEEHVYISKP